MPPLQLAHGTGRYVMGYIGDDDDYKDFNPKLHWADINNDIVIHGDSENTMLHLLRQKPRTIAELTVRLQKTTQQIYSVIVAIRRKGKKISRKGNLYQLD